MVQAVRKATANHKLIYKKKSSNSTQTKICGKEKKYVCELDDLILVIIILNNVEKQIKLKFFFSKQICNKSPHKDLFQMFSVH